MRMIRKKIGQSALEYAVLIIIIAGALLAMNVYIKRGVQGRMRSAADDIGEQFTTVGNVTVSVNSVSQTLETANAQGVRSQITGQPSVTNRVESLNLAPANQEYWGR